MVVFKLACFDGFHVAAGSWIFWPPGCSPRTSEVGTDLRAVRVCGPGAFGEIALLRRCLGEVGSQQQSGIFGKLPV